MKAWTGMLCGARSDTPAWVRHQIVWVCPFRVIPHHFPLLCSRWLLSSRESHMVPPFLTFSSPLILPSPSLSLPCSFLSPSHSSLDTLCLCLSVCISPCLPLWPPLGHSQSWVLMGGFREVRKRSCLSLWLSSCILRGCGFLHPSLIPSSGNSFLIQGRGR